MEKQIIRLFISQPMNGKTNEQIQQERDEAVESAKCVLVFSIKEPFDVEVIDSFFKDAPHNAKPLWFLGKSLELLSTADVAFFCRGWSKYRGCKIEYTCATEYNIPTICDGMERIERR